MNYSFFDKFVIRTPIKPIQNDLGEVDKNSILDFFKGKEGKEALYLASFDLYNELEKYLVGEFNNDKEDKFIESLYKYYLRIHYRTIPFGLFASCGVGKWSEETKINMQYKDGFYRHTRLDMSFMFSLTKMLERFPQLQIFLKYTPNNSIYHLNEQIRYTEYVYRGARRSFQLNSVNEDYYLKKTLSFAESGRLKKELIKNLQDDDISQSEATEYIEELIDSQVLTSNLNLGITGKDPLLKIIDFLSQFEEKSSEVKKLYFILSQIQKKLNKLDENKYNDISAYNEIVVLVSQLGIDFNKRSLFQVDSYYEPKSNLTISKKVLKQLKQCLYFFMNLNESPKDSELDNFAKAFYKKYEDQEIPMVEALDDEIGIGFPLKKNSRKDEPILKDLSLPNSSTTKNKLRWGKNEQKIFDCILEGLRANQTSIDISKIDFDTTSKVASAQMPNTFSCDFSLIESKKEHNPLIYLSAFGNVSATSLLGRFTYGNKNILGLVEDIVSKEEDIDHGNIVAEIVHLPEITRLGNVLIHPAFRTFEIPYLASPSKRAIAISDILIKVYGNGQIVLRSKQHNKEIIPVLSNAHMLSGGLPIYRFLGAMQSQNKLRTIFFNIGGNQSIFSFIPRIQWNDIILRKATWQLRKSDFEGLIKNGGDVKLRLLAFRQKWNLPNQIYYLERDNRLFIDFTNELSQSLFINTIKNKKSILLEEFLYDSKFNPVSDSKGNVFVNQIIASLYKNVQTSRNNKNANNPTTSKKIRRKFAPGSKWLYFKIYCEPKITDHVLITVLRPLIRKYQKNKWIKRWFFLRYDDSEHHIRIRFEVASKENIASIMETMNKIISKDIENRSVNKIQLDTYNRELERYGPLTMELSEELFCLSSTNTLEFLNLYSKKHLSDETRWLYAIARVDTFLDAFAFDLEKRKAILKVMKDSFSMEFKMDKRLKRQMDGIYRKYSKEIENWINKKNFTVAKKVLTYENEEFTMGNIASKILTILDDKNSELNLESFIISHVHMIINRISKSNPRLYELLIYYLMDRYYGSALARRKYHS